MTKIFVKKLKKNIDDKKLADYFKKFGEIKNAYVICDPENGRSKGFGYVQFVNKETLNEVLAQKHKIGDKEVFITRFEMAEFEKKQKNQAAAKISANQANANGDLIPCEATENQSGSFMDGELGKAFNEGFDKATQMFNMMNRSIPNFYLLPYNNQDPYSQMGQPAMIQQGYGHPQMDQGYPEFIPVQQVQTRSVGGHQNYQNYDQSTQNWTNMQHYNPQNYDQSSYDQNYGYYSDPGMDYAQHTPQYQPQEQPQPWPQP
jgi:RNA recognition motif-containing protein